MNRLGIFFAVLALAGSAFANSVHSRRPGFPIDTAKAFRGMPSRTVSETVPNQIRIKFMPEVAAQYAFSRPNGDRTHALLLGGATEISDLTFMSRIARTGWTLWSVPDGTNLKGLVANVRKEKGVVYAETVNRIYPLLVQPNDPDFNYEETSEDYIFDLDDSGAYDFRKLWYLDDTNAFSGWSTWPNTWYTAATMPSHRPIIAVIDTGIDPNHRDFINAGGTGTDVTHGGQINFALSGQSNLGNITPGSSVTDIIVHGTHVTGLALASGNNGGWTHDEGDGQQVTNGMIGMGYNCQAMILKVFDDNGVGTDTDAAGAMYYAADNSADVINLSLGEFGNYSQLFQDAVTYAFQKGSLVVAAGYENAQSPGASVSSYPAACSGCLAVEAEAPFQGPATDNYAGVGNYVDLAAPGGDLLTDQATYFAFQYVWSTTPNYNYAFFNPDPEAFIPYWYAYTYLVGSSMASPQVAGAAGLYYGMMNYHQADGYVNVRTYRQLENSADNVFDPPYNSWEPTFGYGGLNIGTFMANTSTRNSGVGSIKGMVYNNSSIALGVAVKAQLLTGGFVYQTTTSINDGSYRFEALPPGTYRVTSTPNGNVKSKIVHVIAGSDQPGFDLWCGSFTGDDTAPTVPFFNVTGVTATSMNLHQWGYDTETGVDTIMIQIGTSVGGQNVMAPTQLVPDSNTSTFSGLSLQGGTTYYVRGIYTNGGGLVTTVDTTFTYGTVVSATSFSVFRGVLLSGNLGSLLNIDGNRMAIQLGLTLGNGESPDQLIVTTTSPTQTASSISATVVSQVNTTGLNQDISLFDYTANAWVVVDTRAASKDADSTVTATASNPNRFIKAGTKQMMIRVRYLQAGPTSLSQWQSKTDLVQWTLGP